MKKTIIISVHLAFWAVLLIIPVMFGWAEQFGLGYKGVQRSFFELSIDLLADGGLYVLHALFVFYAFYLYFLPRILREESFRYKTGALLFILLSPSYFLYVATFTMAAFFWESIVLFVYVLTCSMALFGSLFRFAFDWFDVRVRAAQLQKQNLQTELVMLKNQINPHFFFNTINNIDSLINSNADKASAMLLKLSDMMRYMIYDTDSAKVQLSQDIRHIENYISLQRIQFSNQKMVVFSVNGSPDEVSVAPMLFLPFVENAFKHCTNKSLDGAIKIEFAIEHGAIKFSCKNIFDKSVDMSKDVSSGVGLSNLKRRLELIYPNLHELSIEEKEGIFSAKLTISTDGN